MRIKFETNEATASGARMNGHAKIGESSVNVNSESLSVSMISSKSGTDIAWFTVSRQAARRLIELMSAMLEACPSCGGRRWNWGERENSGKHMPCEDCGATGMQDKYSHPDTDTHLASCSNCKLLHTLLTESEGSL